MSTKKETVKVEAQESSESFPTVPVDNPTPAKPPASPFGLTKPKEK